VLARCVNCILSNRENQSIVSITEQNKLPKATQNIQEVILDIREIVCIQTITWESSRKKACERRKKKQHQAVRTKALKPALDGDDAAHARLGHDHLPAGDAPGHDQRQRSNQLTCSEHPPCWFLGALEARMTRASRREIPQDTTKDSEATS